MLTSASWLYYASTLVQRISDLLTNLAILTWSCYSVHVLAIRRFHHDLCWYHTPKRSAFGEYILGISFGLYLLVIKQCLTIALLFGGIPCHGIHDTWDPSPKGTPGIPGMNLRQLRWLLSIQEFLGIASAKSRWGFLLQSSWDFMGIETVT
jgi:hypothetical protein